MEVRWRLFARDVLSMPTDDDGDFLFGRPPRPVRGLRLLGVVVHRSRSRSQLDLDKAGADSRADGDWGGAGGDGGSVDGESGSLAVDDGTGVVEVRLPMQLWESVGLHDQVKFLVN